jgi:hypothetical protein
VQGQSIGDWSNYRLKLQKWRAMQCQPWNLEFICPRRQVLCKITDENYACHGRTLIKNIINLPRSDVKPSKRLLRQIFPFIEIQELKIALLTNSIHWHLPVFSCQEFNDFQHPVVATIIVAAENDPDSASVQSVLIGVCERMYNFQKCLEQDAARICTYIQQADEYFRTQHVSKS